MRWLTAVFVVSCRAATPAPPPDAPHNAVPTITLYGRSASSHGWTDAAAVGPDAERRCNGALGGFDDVVRPCSPDPLPPAPHHDAISEIVSELDDGDTHLVEHAYRRFASNNECVAWASTVDVRVGDRAARDFIRDEAERARRRADEKCEELARFLSRAESEPPDMRREDERLLRRECEQERLRATSLEHEATIRRHTHQPRCLQAEQRADAV